MKKIDRLKRIKAFLLLFIFFLFLSGLTAIPIDSELTLLLHFAPPHSALEIWLSRVLSGYQITKEKYPFLLYGYDWLAFAHFVLAILFVGPYKNPVRIKTCLTASSCGVYHVGFPGVDLVRS